MLSVVRTWTTVLQAWDSGPWAWPRREVAIWWPMGHSAGELCLAFPVLAYVVLFPYEVVV